MLSTEFFVGREPLSVHSASSLHSPDLNGSSLFIQFFDFAYQEVLPLTTSKSVFPSPAET